MRERFGHEKNGSRTRSGGSRTRKTARVREKRLALKKNRSRGTRAVRAEPEPFARSRSVSKEVRGLLLVYRNVGPKGPASRQTSRRIREGKSPARWFSELFNNLFEIRPEIMIRTAGRRRSQGKRSTREAEP